MKTYVTADGEIKGVFLRTPYNYDMNKASDEAGLVCEEQTLAQQQFKDESDINTIVERFGITGELPENVRVPQSGDFSEVVDFQSALNIVRAAEEAFMEMPANVRERFNNDPGKFLEFTNDKDNLAEARKLGIAMPEPEAPKEPAPVRVRVVPEETPKA